MSARRGARMSMLRLAFRNLRRHKGRSVLICVLIGLPVAAAVAADTLELAQQPPPRAFVREQLGSADAEVRDARVAQVEGHVTSRFGGYTQSNEVPEPREPLTEAELIALLPPGSRTELPCVNVSGINALATSGELAVSTSVTACEATSLGAAALKVRDGRLPAAPDEVAISSQVAKRLDLSEFRRLREGSTLALDDGATAKVVGIVDERIYLKSQAVFVAHKSTVIAMTKPSDSSVLVEFPADVRSDPIAIQAAATKLYSHGVSAVFRDGILHPDRYETTENTSTENRDLSALLLGAMFVGFGLVEVVLLAGAAMSVGMRRQAREIGLIGAIGGDRRDVRRFVITQTLAYALTASTLAIPVGLLVVVAARPLIDLVSATDMSTLGFAPLHWFAYAAFGILGGLLAGWLPARGIAKLSTVDALAGRLGNSRMKVAVPVKRFVVVAAGAAIALIGGARLFAALKPVEPKDSAVVIAMVVLMTGVLTATLALVSLMSPLLGLVGQRVSRLPLDLRFAVRDLGRQRSRTAPATAAVMVAVAGALGVSFVLAGTDAQGRRDYDPWLPMGDISVTSELRGDVSGTSMTAVDDRLGDVVAAATAVVPRSTVLPMRTVSSTTKYSEVNEYVTPLVVPQRDDGGFDEVASAPYDLYLADAAVVRHVLPDDADAILAKLAAGQAVVLNPERPISKVGIIRDGNDAWDPTGTVLKPVDVTLSVTPMQVTFGSSLYFSGTVLVSEQMVKGLGLRVNSATTALIVPPSPIDAAKADQVRAAVEKVGGSALPELGYTSSFPMASLIAAGVAGFVAIAATVISLALIQSEGRADLATLAAVGANPSRRRLITFWQALTIALIGGVTGTLLGGFIAFASRAIAGHVAVPWVPVLLVTVVLPLASAGPATLFSRSQLPMVRRLA